jgi:flagellar M-ring protein FliF
MAALDQAGRLVDNLKGLGTKRLLALGLIGLLVFALTGVAGYLLSRPAYEPLYSGLDRADVGRIGSALRDAGLSFDVSSDGTAVMIAYGQTAQARMILAEKGLPTNSSAGYELFDKLGSLGLTSFMQEVTRVRAIEGELARTIQLMRGIKAARVHIVLPDEGSFRRQRKPSSASVVLRMEGSGEVNSAQAIRHLVSASVPGLGIDQVTVLTTDGRLLSSASDGSDTSMGRKLELENSVSNEVQSNIRKTLAPYLSLKNFQVSVAARLNVDRRETNETTFNPESRVERSVRVIKETQASQNASSQSPAGVTSNIPQDRSRNADGKQSSEENQKREEVTNYEVSSKRTSVVSSGYTIDHLSVAVLVNRASLGAGIKPEEIDTRIAEIEQLVMSAAGLRKDRGDAVKISAVDFLDSGELEPVPPLSIIDLLERNSGTLIKSLSAIAVAFMIVFLGLRPALKALSEQPAPMETFAESPMLPTMSNDFSDSLGTPQMGDSLFAAQPEEAWPEDEMLGDLARNNARSPQKRLEHLIQYNEDQAVAIMRAWLREGKIA